MGYGTNGLTFNTLRGANAARLPQFKNSKGGVAHTKADGSDWSPAQWLGAMLGEIGEWAEVRIEYEQGQLTYAQFKEKSTKEVADIQTYLDIFARRSLDTLTDSVGPDFHNVPGGDSESFSPAQHLMAVIACLGSYANARKKYERGDFSHEEYRAQRHDFLQRAKLEMDSLFHYPSRFDELKQHPGDAVQTPNPQGVDLGEATMEKFNQVSERVGSNIYMDAEDWHYRNPHAPQEDRRR